MPDTLPNLDAAVNRFLTPFRFPLLVGGALYIFFGFRDPGTINPDKILCVFLMFQQPEVVFQFGEGLPILEKLPHKIHTNLSQFPFISFSSLYFFLENCV
jgi:hypothetical protein